MLWNYLKLQMMKYPNKKLCDINNCSYSYSEIIVIVENFSKELVSDSYAILCKSELNATIGVLACLASKKVAIPLSYSYGKIHNDAILSFIKTEYIITDISGELKIIKSGYSGYNHGNINPALILCTSGTTGEPKGVMLTESAIMNNLNCIDYGLYGKENVLIIRPIFHCGIIIGEVLYSLIRGFNIYYYNSMFLPQKLCRIIVNYKISIMGATPSLLILLGKFLMKNDVEINLHIIKISGECSTLAVAKQIRKAFPKALIYNFYGLTEACARVSCLLPSKFDKRPNSVGKVLSGIESKIVNTDGYTVKNGKCGELMIKSASLMTGYYNNNELTNKKLIDGWLLTGDIAKKDDEGNLYILCRKDDMIIRSGINIYPQQIENALLKNDDIKEVVAYANSDSNGIHQISIDVVTNKLDVTNIFKLCNSILPKHMNPDKINIVDKIPKTVSGKKIRRNNYEKVN